MTGLYITLSAVGSLVGIFVAGLVVALAQAFPGGSAGALNGAELTGVGLGIVVAGTAVGAVTAGLAHGVRWLRARYLGRQTARFS